MNSIRRHICGLSFFPANASLFSSSFHLVEWGQFLCFVEEKETKLL